MPETPPIYAIGDVHGHLDMLQDAVHKIERDGGTDARVVLLGDYIDRGPDSRAVIEYLMDAQANGRNWVFLKGNHDQMLTMFLEDYPRTPIKITLGYHWLHERIGGRETLANYGVFVSDGDRTQPVHEAARKAVPKSHIKFLESLPVSHQEAGLLFVHAGLRPGIPLEEQDPEDLLWIRKEFLDDSRCHPQLVIHGHTPVPAARHYGNRVNLDSGAGYGKPLTTTVFEGNSCWVLTQTGREPLSPDPMA